MPRRSRETVSSDSEDISPDDFSPVPSKKSKTSPSNSTSTPTPPISKAKKEDRKEKRTTAVQETGGKNQQSSEKTEVLVLDSDSEDEKKEDEKVTRGKRSESENGNGSGNAKGKGKEKMQEEDSFSTASTSTKPTSSFSPPNPSTSTLPRAPLIPASPPSAPSTTYPPFLPSPRSEIPTIPFVPSTFSSSSTANSSSIGSILRSETLKNALQKDKSTANDFDDSEPNDRDSPFGDAVRSSPGYGKGLRGFHQASGVSPTSPGARLKRFNDSYSSTPATPPLQLAEGTLRQAGQRLEDHKNAHHGHDERQEQQPLACQGVIGGDAEESIGQADGKVISEWEIDRGLYGFEKTETHAVLLTDLEIFLLNLGVSFGVIAHESDLSQLVWHGVIRTQIWDFVRMTGPVACLVIVAGGPTKVNSMAVVVAPKQLSLGPDVKRGLITFPRSWLYTGVAETTRIRLSAAAYPPRLAEEIRWTADRRYSTLASSVPLHNFDQNLQPHLLCEPVNLKMELTSLDQPNRHHCKNLDTVVRTKALDMSITQALDPKTYFSASARVLLRDGSVGKVIKILKLLPSKDPASIKAEKEVMFGGSLKVTRVPWEAKTGAKFGEGAGYSSTSALAPKQYHKDTPFSTLPLFAASHGRVKTFVLTTYLAPDHLPAPSSASSSASSFTVDVLSSLAYSKEVSPYQCSDLSFETLAPIHSQRALLKYVRPSDRDSWLVRSTFKGTVRTFDPLRTLDLHPEAVAHLKDTSMLAFLDTELAPAAKMLSLVEPSHDGQPLARFCEEEARVFLTSLARTIPAEEMARRRSEGSRAKEVDEMVVSLHEHEREEKKERDTGRRQQQLGGLSADEEARAARANRKKKN